MLTSSVHCIHLGCVCALIGINYIKYTMCSEVVHMGKIGNLPKLLSMTAWLKMLEDGSGHAAGVRCHALSLAAEHRECSQAGSSGSQG